MNIPARKIRPTKGRNYRSKISRSKSLRIIHAESLLERDYVKLCNFDKRVKAILYQPIGIKYNYKGRTRKYFPDYLLLTKDNKYILVEVKLKKFANTDKNKAKFLAAQEHCSKNGWGFIVVSEDQVRPGYLQYNLSLLLEVKVYPETTIIVEYILTLLAFYKEITLGDLMKKCNLINNSIFLVNLYKLIYSERVVTDLVNKKLSMDSILELGREGENEK